MFGGEKFGEFGEEQSFVKLKPSKLTDPTVHDDNCTSPNFFSPKLS